MASRARQRQLLIFANNKVGPNLHGWATLIPDLLLLILQQLPIKDYVRFGAVCVSWNRIVAKKLVSPVPQSPWLVISPINNKLPLVMFDPFNKVEERMTQFQERGLFLGSTSDGYIFLFQEYSSQLLVMNPLTGSRIPLPSTETLLPKKPWIFKATLYRPITGATAVVAIAYNGNKIAFSRNGDKMWSLLGESECGIEDIIFYKGLLYVTTLHGSMSWDIELKHPLLQQILSPERNEYESYMSYKSLVQSSTGSDLLQIIFNPPKPIKILRLELAATPKWCRVSGLCAEDALLLSPHQSVCISTREFPVLRGNCIYSTLYQYIKEKNRPKDYSPLHVYNLDNASMEYLPLPCCQVGSTPDWFTPYLW